MYIEELKEGELDCVEEQQVCGDPCEGGMVVWDPKRVLVGAGARALFYPTLLYNVVRNKIQSEFRWWDRVDEDYGIEHLVIPTRDYLFAPSLGDICQAVEFIHENALSGKTTYVHCKAGRGRSTTIVLCYLVKHKQMTPEVAYKYVRSIRPRVLLASPQWQAVQGYYHGLKKPEGGICVNNSPDSSLVVVPVEVHLEDTDDDNLLVLITESDLDGYKENVDLDLARHSFFAISGLPCTWLRCHMGHKESRKKAQKSVNNGQLKSTGVDISVY